ncbi:transposase [Xanthobacter autotrophicus NCIMB 11399]|uniref:transposase n=1 Tax=Xanthobacter wiegelii TaxID=3119913 RepID=UPI0037288423
MAKSIGRLLKALETELADIGHDIDDSIRRSPNWLDKTELLKSVPGIGVQIARTFIIELPELGTLDRRQIAALFGLAPWTRQSANGAARASSAADAQPSEPPSTWARPRRRSLASEPSAIGSSLMANPSSSTSSSSPESSSPSSMHSSGISSDGENKPLDRQTVAHGIGPTSLSPAGRRARSSSMPVGTRASLHWRTVRRQPHSVWIGLSP